MGETPKEQPSQPQTPAQKIVNARNKGEAFLKQYGDDIPQTARVREEMAKMESHFDRSGQKQPTRQDYENASKFADRVLGIVDGFDYEKAKADVLESKLHEKINPVLRMNQEYEEKYYSAVDMADEVEIAKYRNLLRADNVLHYIDEKVTEFYQQLSPQDKKRMEGRVVDAGLRMWENEKVLVTVWQVHFSPEGYTLNRQGKG